MTQPIKNACTALSDNVYGGFEHTLFLGLSVMSFSASVGLNQQVSECTIQLVEDKCPAPGDKPKYYWDSSLYKQSTTSPDPGIVIDQTYVGAPMFFRVDSGTGSVGFEFSGILQSIQEHNQQRGRPTYTAKLISPQEILRGVSLIINDYAGSTVSVPNLYNCFGFLESFGNPCPEVTLYGAEFGTPAGGFGGSGVNDNGMQWNQILTAFNILCNSIPALGGQWSPVGSRVQFVTGGSMGYGVLPGGLYYVDVSELPVTPDYYRLSGANIGLLDSVHNVCTEAGYDYFLELIPVRDEPTLDATGIAKFIKFRTAYRGTQPGIGEISTFLGNANGLIQSAEGFELRNDTTSTFYFGGNKQTVYQNYANDPINCDETDIILPYFGIDSNYDVIVPCKDGDGWWEFEVETEKIDAQFTHLALPNTVTIHERELLFAQGGFDGWLTFERETVAQGVGTDIGNAIESSIGGLDAFLGLYSFNNVFNVLQDVNNKRSVFPEDFFANQRSKDPGSVDTWGEVNEELQRLHEWINTFATEFYGKKFSVRVPYTCVKVDNESGKVITSEYPQVDGWTEVPDILELDTTGPLITLFQNDSGKYDAMALMRAADEKSFENLQENDFGIVDNKGYIKVSVEDDWVFHDFANRLYPRGVVTLPQAVTLPDDVVGDKENPQNMRMLSQLWKYLTGFAKKDVLDITDNIGGIVINEYLPYRMYMPDGVSFGIRSTIDVYGPWGYSGIAGQTRVQHQQGLVPWQYGGETLMNTAGVALASQGVTNMRYGEEGSATVAGYPTIPLGAELGAVAGGFFGAGEQLIENRAASSDNWTGDHVSSGPTTYTWGVFNYTGGNFTGLYGPNVTGITTTVGEGQITTSYTFRTFTPKFGRFADYNAKRLAAIGQNSIRAKKELSANFIQRAKREIRTALIKDKRRRLFGARKMRGHSPHSVLAGQLKPWKVGSDTFRRTKVASEPMAEISVEINRDYDEKAFMSLDGLIRPVSMDGDGNLPRYTNYNPGCQSAQSQGATGPVYEGGSNCSTTSGPHYAGTGTNEQINQDYLNPFTNPTAFNRSAVVDDKSDTPNIGHDVDVLGRKDTGATSGYIPESGMVMPIAGYDNAYKMDYEDDYRMFAMKGPMLLQAWGYDLDGRPIPNKVDTEAAASGGDFVATGLKCKFMDDWLRKPHSWPVGPIDLRWDRQRGVWVSPPPVRQVIARLCSGVCPGNFTMGHVDTGNQPELYDCNGTQINTPVVPLHSKSTCYFSGDMVIADYDPYECKYYIKEGPASRIVPFKVTKCINLNDSPAGSGVRVDCNGSEIGESFPIYPGIADKWGPAPSGFRGWLDICCVESSSNCYSPFVLQLENAPQFIDYNVTGVDSNCKSDGTVTFNNTWQGVQSALTSANLHVQFPSWYCGCVPPSGSLRGIAVLNPKKSWCTGDGEYTYEALSFPNNHDYITIDTGCLPSGNVGFDQWSHIDVLKFGRGFYVQTGEAGGAAGDNQCTARIMAGVEATGVTGVPVNWEANFGSLTGLYNKLHLYNMNASGDGCNLHIQGGIKATGATGCMPTGGPVSDTTSFTRLRLHSGIMASGYDNDLHLAGGIHATGDPSCISVGSNEIYEENLHNRLIVHSGIGAYSDNCNLHLGLDFSIDGNKVVGFTTGPCLDFNAIGSCSGELQLNLDGVSPPSGVELITGLSCSGESISASTLILQFNSCGQVVGTGAGSGITLECCCSGSGG